MKDCQSGLTKTKYKIKDINDPVVRLIEETRQKKKITISKLCNDAKLTRESYYNLIGNVTMSSNFYTIFLLLKSLDISFLDVSKAIERYEKKHVSVHYRKHAPFGQQNNINLNE